MNVMQRWKIWLCLIVVVLAVGQIATAQAQENPGRTFSQELPGRRSNTTSPEAVDNLEDAREAVVQIEAVGTFMDRQEGLLANAAGRGSGFIIDEAGIAVTNNHVVTGGGLFRVFVDGYDEPLNARVLGVSECTDLAVIDIQGSGFPFLDWNKDPIKVGLDVYAAGFPLGDPEYTLTRGIVSKAHADGDTPWASLDYVLEHDARINPGNSGGPLLDSDGQVVGVNYGRNDDDQYFAISRDIAIPILEEMLNGVDVGSLGINGEAVVLGEDITGIWIASVQSGSPADDVGIQPGDVLLSIEGITLATDGTMSTYCEILHSHGPDDVMSIEVLRLDTEEVLEGQINGRSLAQSFSIAERVDETAPDESTPSLQTEGYTEFVEITDEQGIVSAEVPSAWQDVREGPWTVDDEHVGILLVATPDYEAWKSGWETPGAVIRYSTALAGQMKTDDLLDALDYSGECTYDDRFPLDEGYFQGAYDIWHDCGDAGSSALIMALIPEAQEDYVVRIEIYSVTDADFAVIDKILDSFLVTSSEQEADPLLEDQGTNSYRTVEDVNTAGLEYDYALVEDETIVMLAPQTWQDSASEDWIVDDEKMGLQFSLSPNLRRFNAGTTAPGILAFLMEDVGDDVSIADTLEVFDFSDECEYADRREHNHTIYGITYTGAYDVWTNCGQRKNTYVMLSAASQPVDHILLIYFLATTDADLEAFDIMAKSFYSVTPGTADLVEKAQAQGDRRAEGELALADDTGAFALNVPASWSDVVNDDWVLEGDVMGRMLTAAPDLIAYEKTWTEPGLFLSMSDMLGSEYTPEEFLAFFEYSDECTYDGVYEFGNDAGSGVYDIWLDCGGIEGDVFLSMVGNPTGDDENLFLLQINLPLEEDQPIFEQVLASLAFDGAERPAVRSSSVTPLATIIVKNLNMRRGPGTNYKRVGVVRQGDNLEILGQSGNCSWLFVTSPDGQNGWVSGSADYVSMQADCDDIPEASAPSAESSTAPNQAGSSPPAPVQSQANTGCYLFQNQLGAELTITFTSADGSWNRSFTLGQGADREQCFAPGRYTYTLDAPPPWGSTNDSLDVEAGDYYLFPITPG